MLHQAVHIILARDDTDGIGLRGSIPWVCKEDMRFFRDVTMGTYDPDLKNAVVVGNTTMQSMPKHLHGRHICVMHRDGTFTVPDDTEHIFIGGGSISIRRYFDRCSRDDAPWPSTIILSRIPGEYHCDTYITDDDLMLEKYEKYTTFNNDKCLVDVYTKRGTTTIKLPKTIFLMLSDITNT
jgi:dihydrofolate reductase